MPKYPLIIGKLSKVTVPAEITKENYKLTEKFLIFLYSTRTNTDDRDSAR